MASGTPGASGIDRNRSRSCDDAGPAGRSGPAPHPLHATSRAGNDGAGTRIRTADPRFTKPLLYPLSYAGNGAILLLAALP